VILALPAYTAATLVENVNQELAAELNKIAYAGCAIAALGYRRAQIASDLQGFGFVVPAVERRHILAASYSSSKFDGRAPEGSVLMRVFLGGAERPEQLELDDAALVEVAQSDLRDLLGIEGPAELVRVVRWPRSMPQYHLGHAGLVARIEKQAEATPRLALAGNAYHGVGVPNCIHSGEQAAERLLAAFPLFYREEA
jgi:oxygen-dependent protoporphyrinogen oxidase